MAEGESIIRQISTRRACPPVACMNYNVAQLLKEPVGSHRSFSLGEPLVDPDPLAQRVAGSGRMVRTHQGIWVQANITVTVAQDCSRCLTDFNRPLGVELDEEYLPQRDVKTGRRLASPEDWSGLYIGDDHVLGLSEAIRQSAISTLPLKPLCRPDCHGICDRCGMDRNQSECDCRALAIDPRWAVLRSLIAD